MNCREVNFSGHAVQRMFQRRISEEEILAAVATGEVIAEYLDDQPFPSFLALSRSQERALHVVVAVDRTSRSCFVVTTYLADPLLWSDDFRTRRSP